MLTLLFIDPLMKSTLLTLDSRPTVADLPENMTGHQKYKIVQWKVFRQKTPKKMLTKQNEVI
jgi:hypothetical protein